MQRLTHGFGRLDTAKRDVIAALAEQVDHHLRVELGVFDDEDAERSLHGGGCRHKKYTNAGTWEGNFRSNALSGEEGREFFLESTQ